MAENAVKGSTNQVAITVSVPVDIGNDLAVIASFNDITVENLVYAYIVEGLSGDSRILKRTECNRNSDETLNKDDFHSKSPREIANEFNVLY